MSVPKLFWEGPCWMLEQGNMDQASVLAPSCLPEQISLSSAPGHLLATLAITLHAQDPSHLAMPSSVVGLLLSLRHCRGTRISWMNECLKCLYM